MEKKTLEKRARAILALVHKMKEMREQAVPDTEIVTLFGSILCLINEWQVQVDFYDPSIGNRASLKKHLEELAGFADNERSPEEAVKDIAEDIKAYVKNCGAAFE